MKHTILLRLDNNINENLDKLYKELDKNKSYIIKKAINHYLKNYSDYQIALDRLHNMDDEIIFTNEMKTRLDL